MIPATMRSILSTNFGVGITVAFLWLSPAPSTAADFPTNAPSPTATQANAQRRAAAAMDHQRMMELLNLPAPGPFPALADDASRPTDTHRASTNSPIWKDNAGHVVQRSFWGTWSNYEESKANNQPTPDALILKNGRPVKDADTWWKLRRPEITNDFITEIYGRTPEKMPKVKWEVLSEEFVLVTNSVTGTTTITRFKRIRGDVNNSLRPGVHVSLMLTLYIPARANGPVPVILKAGGGLDHDSIATRSHEGALNQLLAHGWGYANFNTTNVQADTGAGFDDGIIGLMSKGSSRKPDDWGVLAAWSWGLSRALDYLETDPAVDARQVGLEGVSRWGKEVLMTMAFDPRFAIVYCSCSGEGGAKLHRRNFGETLNDVAGPSEYHWLAGNFIKYGGHWNDLPVDANELIALCAPRPVFITGGTEDLWADPTGEFLACVGAGPVYQLLGKQGLGTATLPEPDVELISGDLGFRLHKGGHSDLQDWPAFLKFADKYLKAN